MISLYDLGLNPAFTEFDDQRLREPKKRIHYFFPLEDVFNSVYRTTSLIGKHRKTKEGISRLDDIALTQDEYDTFLDLANDAGLEVFTKINAFINNEQPSYIFNDGVNNTHIRFKNNGKTITVNSLTSKNYALKTNITFNSAIVDYEMDCHETVARILSVTEEVAIGLVQNAPFTLLEDVGTEEALEILTNFEGIGNVELDPFVKVKFLSPKTGSESDCITELASLLGITNFEASQMIAQAPFVLYARISERELSLTSWGTIANIEYSPIYDGFEYEYDITLDKALEDNDQLNVNIIASYNIFNYMGDVVERPYVMLHLHTEAETNFKYRHIFIPDLDTEPSEVEGVLPEVFNSLLALSIDYTKVNYITPDIIYPFDWVEYTDVEKSLFIALKETDMNSEIPNEELYKLMEDDVRYSIHYLVFQPAWVANNATIKTDKSTFEAIVAYIIFKWFLIVLPEEAELYLETCNDRLRDVKMNLNLPTGRIPIISNPF